MRALVLALGLALALTGPAAAQKGPATPAQQAADPAGAAVRGPTPSTVTNPVWLERPSAQDFSRYFPAQAMEEGVSGRVVMECMVNSEGRLECTVISHEPEGYGFDEAALRVARHFRIAPTVSDGQPAERLRIRFPIRFVAPEWYVPPQ